MKVMINCALAKDVVQKNKRQKTDSYKSVSLN